MILEKSKHKGSDYFRKLAQDYPMAMDFVPSKQVLLKLIERAN
jgi:hypothetical protein